MDLSKLLYDLFNDYTFRTIALGSAILGVVSGVLGCFALLRRQSLLGDTLSHAALPGVVIAFLISGGSKNPLVLLTGAAVAGWLGALLLTVTVRYTRIKEDAAQGVVLSVFFGTGYVLLSMLQDRKSPLSQILGGKVAAQAGLDRFLFGSAASMIESDVITMAVLGALVLVITILLFKEFKLLAFDPDFLATQGFPVRGLDIALTSLIVISIMIGLQTVGVVLMSAMLIAPAAAARQWTNRLSVMILIAAIIGSLSGMLGAGFSAELRAPTGPAIVLTLMVLTLISFLFGRQRGLLWDWVQRLRIGAEIRTETALIALHRIALRHGNTAYAAPIGLIGVGTRLRTMRKLAEQGLVRANPNQTWSLTEAGFTAAQAAIYSRQQSNGATGNEANNGAVGATATVTMGAD